MQNDTLIAVTLTAAEASFLIQVLDAVLRQSGLQHATQASDIAMKINAAHTAVQTGEQV